MLTGTANLFPLLDYEASQLSKNTICAMTSHSRRRPSIDCATVDSALASGASNQSADPPSPQIGMPQNEHRFSMAAPPRPAVKHSRTLSYTPNRPNRLSLSFPVAPSLHNGDFMRPTPTSSTAPSFPPTPIEVLPLQSPSDQTGFLVALASQERKVLELKEELSKAEADLVRLKREWARHEQHKKSGEMRHLQQLQPLQASIPSSTRSSEDGSTVSRQSLESERRKIILSNINLPKEPRRKVITGGHTRALSLLSPERMNFAQPFPPVKEDDSNSGNRSVTALNHGIRQFNTNRARHSYQGGVTHGAKQIAEDVKAGLWTFLEDLRQATVGDEAVNGTKNQTSVNSAHGTNRRGSRDSLASNERRRNGQGSNVTASPRTWDSLTGTDIALLDTSSVNWEDSKKEESVESASVNEKPVRSLPLAAPPVDDDGWANWDSPLPKSPLRWSGSTDTTEPATPSNSNLDDRGVGIVRQSEDGSDPSSVKREDLQWTALENLKPGNLKRTVSTIMKEWEKSLTPPQEEGPMSDARQRRGRGVNMETPSRMRGSRTREKEKGEGLAKEDELMMS